MLLKSVSFKDYCLYAGEHTFDLAPRRDSSQEKVQTKPVVLFGGKNGAGKTTLLDALRLGLYGKQSFEGTISEASYKEELKSRIHISRDGIHKPQNAKIAIEFDIASHGQTASYKIDRNWELKNDKIEERLRVFKDGLLLDETETKHWPTFIAEIVPERLSQLFFFDGEKIKNIAEDISSNQSIATSIKSLLGLDIVERLKADLQIYLSTRVKVTKAKDAHKELKIAQEELSQTKVEISKLNQKRSENETTLIGHQNEIRRLKSRLNELGSDFAKNQTDNEEKSDAIKSTLKDLESEMRAQTEQCLAFALCPKLAGRLLGKLEEEEKAKKLLNFAKESSHIHRSIKDQLLKLSNLEASNLEAFENILNETFSAYQTNEENNLEIIHDLPLKTVGKIAQTLEASPQIAVNRVVESYEKYNQAQEDLLNTQRKLEKAPKQELLKPTVDQLTELGKIEGKLEAKKAQYESEEKVLANRKAEIERRISKANAQISLLEKDNQKVSYVTKLSKALCEYEDEITKLKIASLELAVAECFNSIIRKSNFAKSVTVDPETFETNLYDRHNNLIPRSDLSSGEKQIFAIAMLWGLAKTSGRPLPVVIDTPLGRLDSEHRKNLINNYFPEAAHQVIMLSTDTEVDQDLYKDLEPHLSHCFHLVYDAETGRTKAENNYFWKE